MVIGQALDFAAKSMEQKQKENGKLIVTGMLAQLEEETGSDGFLKLQDLTAEQVWAKMVDKGYLNGIRKIMDNVREEDSLPVLKKALSALIPETLQNKKWNRLQDDQIRKSWSTIVNINKTLVEFRASQIKKMEKIEASITNIHSMLSRHEQELAIQKIGILDNYRAIQKHEERLKFLEGFLFNTLPLDQQIQALNAGLLDSQLSKEAKQELQARLELIQEQQKFREGVLDLFKGAESLIQIADNLGVKREHVNIASKALNFGMGVFQTITSIQSESFLGLLQGFSLMTSIFSRGSEKQAEIYKKIFNMLADIQNRIVLVDKKIDVLLEGQKIIIHTQKEILRNIFELHKAIAQNHIEEMKKLEDIHFAVSEVMKKILQLRKDDFDQMGVFLKNRDSDKFFENRKFKDYESLLDHFENPLNYETFQMAYRGVTKHLRHKDRIDSIFELVVQAETSQFLNEVYAPLLNFILENNANNEITSLLFPAKTISELQKKLNHLPQISVNKNYFPKDIKELIATPLSGDAVIKYLRELKEFALYLDLRKPRTESLYSCEDLLSTNIRFHNSGLEILQNCLPIIDVAIAQENLFSGDAVLPLLYKIISAKAESLANKTTLDENTQKSFAKAIKILKHNPLLAKNFSIYFFCEELRKRQANSLTYFLAFSAKDDSLFVKLFSHPWKYLSTTKTEGWKIQLSEEFDLLLPSVEEVCHETIYHTHTLQELQTLKAEIVGKIMEYEWNSSVFPEKNQQIVFNRLLVQSRIVKN